MHAAHLPRHKHPWPRAALALAATAACVGLLASPPTRAQGVNPCMVGDVRLFAGSFEPLRWMFAQGQTLQIGHYPALYSIFGTDYGGNGSTTFKLPNLTSRVPVGMGYRGQTTVYPGVEFGDESVTLMPAHVPGHTHALHAAAASATTSAPTAGAALAAVQNGAAYAPATPTSTLAAATVGSSPGGQAPVVRTPPSLGLNYIICVEGEFPARN